MCELCCNPHRLGVDRFICENEDGVLVENARNTVDIDGLMLMASKRYSFAIHEHEKIIGASRENRIKRFVCEKLSELYGVSRTDIVFFVTMNTFAEHWHIHACVKPLCLIKMTGSSIQAGLRVESATDMSVRPRSHA